MAPRPALFILPFASIVYTNVMQAVYGIHRNDGLSVTKKRTAMLGGATLGWDTPATDPKNYDQQGQPIKHRHRDCRDVQ